MCGSELNGAWQICYLSTYTIWPVTWCGCVTSMELCIEAKKSKRVICCTWGSITVVTTLAFPYKQRWLCYRIKMCFLLLPIPGLGQTAMCVCVCVCAHGVYTCMLCCEALYGCVCVHPLQHCVHCLWSDMTSSEHPHILTNTRFGKLVPPKCVCVASMLVIWLQLTM